jgi:hypothetical protein
MPSYDDEYDGPRDETDMPIEPYRPFPGVDDETADAIGRALDRGYVDPVDHDG